MFVSLLAAALFAAPTPILHLRADSSLAIDDSGNLEEWRDLSPREARFHSPESIQRPRPVSSGLLGKPSVRFWGSHVLTDTSSLPLDSGFTLFFVAQDSNPSGYASLLSQGEGGLSVNLWDGKFDFGLAWARVMARADFSTYAPVLHEVSWDGKTARLFVSGRLEVTGTSTGSAPHRRTTSLGGISCSAGWEGYLQGHVGEVLVYPGELEDSTRIRIETELLAAWGLERRGIWSRAANPLLLHLQADSGLDLDAAGNVRRWKDLSDRGTDFVQPDSVRRPRPGSSWKQNRPSIRFGGRHFLFDSTYLPLDSAFTLLIVAQDSNPSAWTSLLSQGRDRMCVNLWGSDAGNFDIGLAWATAFAKSSFETSKPTLYEATWSGSEARLYASGKLLASGGYTGKPSRGKLTTLAAIHNGTTHEGFLTGRIAEVRIYGGVLDDSRRKTLEDSLLVAWSLDSGSTGLADRSSSRTSGFQATLRGGALSVVAEDGISASLHSPDGAILATARFQGGEAVLPAPRHLAILRVTSPSTTRYRMIVVPR